MPESLHGTLVAVLQRCLDREDGLVFAVAIGFGAGSIIGVAETGPVGMACSRRAIASSETVACS